LVVDKLISQIPGLSRTLREADHKNFCDLARIPSLYRSSSLIYSTFASRFLAWGQVESRLGGASGLKEDGFLVGVSKEDFYA
jgi:hypothetical protein